MYARAAVPHNLRTLPSEPAGMEEGYREISKDVRVLHKTAA